MVARLLKQLNEHVKVNLTVDFWFSKIYKFMKISIKLVKEGDFWFLKSPIYEFVLQKLLYYDGFQWRWRCLGHKNYPIRGPPIELFENMNFDTSYHCGAGL